MRVLVVGASSFVGGRLLLHLLESGGMTVRAGSRVVRDWPVGVEGVILDVTKPAALHEMCEDVDAVINLVSMPEYAASVDPHAALGVTVGGALALASAAAAAGVTRFIQLSSYKVYGNNPGGLITEEAATRPQSHYAVAHRAAEDYVLLQHPNGIVFRLSNGFGAPIGPGGDCWNLIVNQMCRQAVAQGRITIASSGRTWRNFIPMSDVVSALHMAVTGIPSGTYNLGSHWSLTIRQVAEQIARVCSERMGFLPDISVGAPVNGEYAVPLDFRIEKLTGTGFRPVASFDEEVGRTLAAARTLASPPAG